jgi:hypothetical protein
VDPTSGLEAEVVRKIAVRRRNETPIVQFIVESRPSLQTRQSSFEKMDEAKFKLHVK